MNSLQQLPLNTPAESVYPGINGFLSTRGSLMLDVVFLAMFVVVPILALSIYLVKFRGRYSWHKMLQLAMASVLLVTVVLFEIDMRLNDWTKRAIESPYFDPAHKWTCPAGVSLLIHLSFAVPTLLLWGLVVVRALRNFSQPPTPGPHSRWHARWGMTAAVGMLLTAATGWVFYWMAFVATKTA
jgi:hypothetical protein